MKIRKVISLILSVAMSATMLASLATTAFAAPSADSKPEIKATIVGAHDDVYADLIASDEWSSDPDAIVIDFKLVNNETLSYKLQANKYNCNLINAIQCKVALDETVFGSLYSMANADLESAGGQTMDDELSSTFLFPPSGIAAYMRTVPEYLFRVVAYPNTGYDVDSIPADAIIYGESIVEYSSYVDAPKNSPTKNTYTIYAINTTGTKDYDLTVGVDDTFVSGSTEPETPVTSFEIAGESGTVFETATGFLAAFKGKEYRSANIELTSGICDKYISVEEVINGNVNDTKVLPKTIAEYLGFEADSEIPDNLIGNLLMVVVFRNGVTDGATYTFRSVSE